MRCFVCDAGVQNSASQTKHRIVLGWGGVGVGLEGAEAETRLGRMSGSGGETLDELAVAGRGELDDVVG